MKQTAIALTLLLALPMFAEPPANNAASAIARNNTDFTAAAAAGDAARLAAFYADDAVFMAPGAPAMQGRATIRNGWKSFFDMGKVGLTLTTDKVIESCDLATEIGHFTSSITPASGAPMKDVGKYVVTWKRIGGDWRIVADIFNSDVPPPAAH